MKRPTPSTDRTYQKLSVADRKRLGEVVKKTLPDLKLAKPRSLPASAPSSSGKG
jgi:hypothetical protein